MRKIEKILALETTDAQGSVALFNGDDRVAFRRLPTDSRSARTLAPTIREALSGSGWSPKDVDAVAVAVGPGSFTGLRVGLATAKMFAWAVGAEIIGVDSLEAIAAEIKIDADISSADISSADVGADAGRRRVFAEEFERNGGALVSIGVDAQRGDAAIRNFWLDRGTGASPEPIWFALDANFRVVSLKSWLKGEFLTNFNERFDWEENSEKRAFLRSDLFLNKIANVGRENAFFCGGALSRRRDAKVEIDESRLLPETDWNPSALGVASVARSRAKNGDFDVVWRISPIYSRKAAAEERALEKEAAKKAALANAKGGAGAVETR